MIQSNKYYNSNNANYRNIIFSYYIFKIVKILIFKPWIKQVDRLTIKKFFARFEGELNFKSFKSIVEFCFKLLLFFIKRIYWTIRQFLWIIFTLKSNYSSRSNWSIFCIIVKWITESIRYELKLLRKLINRLFLNYW